MFPKIQEFILDLDLNSINAESIIGFFKEPSIEKLKLIGIIYLGLLWLAIIIWVARDAINRSDSVLFQVFAIILNILFPVLGIVLYLIFRPGKTVMERYYEDLEHRLILESIEEKEREEVETALNTAKKATKKRTIHHRPKMTKRKINK